MEQRKNQWQRNFAVGKWRCLQRRVERGQETRNRNLHIHVRRAPGHQSNASRITALPIFSDGDRYEGEWRNDERHGKGVMIYAATTDEAGGGRHVEEKYDGDWLDGKMHGRGVYYYADGSVYDGMWQDGKMHGSGVFIYPNGNRYDGEYIVRFPLNRLVPWCNVSRYALQNDYKEGYGVLQHRNGEKYEVRFVRISRPFRITLMILLWVY